jgi:DNA-binding Xre family transcriptional regulator
VIQKFLPMLLSNYEMDNIALDKLKCTCILLDHTPNDVWEFIPEDNESWVMT